MEGFKMNLCCICLLFFLTMLADSSSSTLDSIVKRHGQIVRVSGPVGDVGGLRRRMCGEGEEYCGAGLYCDTCGDPGPRCTRIKPINPLSKLVNYSPILRYDGLEITKNKTKVPQSRNHPENRWPNTTNQPDTVYSQLYNGVRGLMLEMHDFKDDIWLCHSFGGNCNNYTSFAPATYVLRGVKNFLESNPAEIVTIFIEDHVSSPNGLTKTFRMSGLKKFLFPVSRMPKNGGDWPTVDDMMKQNQRVVVFTSKAFKESSEGIAYIWRYVVENQYGNGGMVDGSCQHRAESSAMNITSKSLVLMNYFPDKPDISTACKHNSAPLVSMVKTCYQAAGRRWPNFIAVDFYKTGDGGLAHEAIDMANGQL